MTNWPAVSIPRTDLSLPSLRIKTTSGTFNSVLSEKPFRMYVCGITPYDATHLGHAATYLTFDLINRYLQLAGQKVDFVENITDIDDPLFERAKRDNQSWEELGDSQIALFESDMAALRVLPPKDYVAVTNAMSSIIFAIEKLVADGFTYELSGSIYFRIAQYLPHLTIRVDDAVRIFAERGGDPAAPGKENRLDPIVWVGNKDDEPGWSSKMGFGRPGWHVECSVIALENLIGKDYLQGGNQGPFAIDLQGGGSDLIFPHHFMTAAIAQALTGIEFASAYVHAGMVGLDGKKMSKSKGNLVLVSTLIKAGNDPMVIRHALLSEGYSADRMWLEETLLTSQARVARIRSALARIEVAPTEKVIQEIAANIADNLDTPKGLQTLDNWAIKTESGEIGGSVGELSRFIDAALGLAL
ncbi:MAG: cysteinyl-tRNA synthetase [Actinomycetales bacterium]|nr:MAG: cysteinyl-tRNA synthetase [Actinomycetales bacterium]